MTFEIANAVFWIIGVAGIVIGGYGLIRYGIEYFRQRQPWRRLLRAAVADEEDVQETGRRRRFTAGSTTRSRVHHAADPSASGPPA